MSTGFQDLPCSLNTFELKATLGAPYLDSTNHFQDLVIPYTGIANPADNDVSLSQFWYSTDAGATWEVMTPTLDTEVTGLSFTLTGTLNLFKWKIKEDLNSDIYNRSIKIAFKATGAAGESLETSRFVLFPRTVSDMTEVDSGVVRFPNDFSGVSGRSLLVNAPKA